MGTDLDIVGGLSKPSKMPGLAFGFSAERCISGSKLRAVAGSVCSDCYACKGMYRFPGVKAAHERRWEKLQNALRDNGARRDYVAAFKRLLAKQEFFRWHDSGDLQSAEHLHLIAEIAAETPHVRHWLPTREYHIVSSYMRTHSIPSNLNIRLSAHMVGQTLNPVAGCTTSAVFEHDAPGHKCPAPTQGNNCGDCRACWSRDVPLVTYTKH
jgi:Gene product 88